MKKICLIATGGTISMKRNKGILLEPSLSGEDILSAIPELNEIASIDTIQLLNLDSSDMQPKNWIEVAKTILENVHQYDGFIVLHGTDTMAYTAAALSFILQNLDKPIIMTGSQKPLCDVATDARNNIINSVKVALAGLNEVCIVFGHEIIRGVRAKKYSEFHLNAFCSLNQQPLGKIGFEIKFSKGSTRTNVALNLSNRLNEKVFLLKIWPGMEPKIIDLLVDLGYKGIVIEAFGAGNVPISSNSLVPQIEDAVKRGVSVVVCTQCIDGCADLSVYRGGNAAFEAGAISGLDMTPETTLVKLMWVLGQTDEHEKIRQMLHTNYAGELTET